MRYVVVELLGTFFLALAISLTGNPLAIGTMLMAMIYMGGQISGGHFNPAVSLAKYLKGTFQLPMLLWYCGAQISGACGALWVFKMVTDNTFVPELVPEIPVHVSALMETVLTGAFVLVVLVVTSLARYRNTAIDGVAAGLTLMAIVFTFIGGLFNPAVAVASIVCAMLTGMGAPMANDVLVHVVAPLAGGAAATYLFAYLYPHD